MMRSPAQPLAFIGLGQMGLPMARRLLDVGYQVKGFDIAETARARLVAAGGLGAESAAEAVAGSSITLLMLPDSNVVEAVVDSLLADGALTAGSRLIDMSSSEPHRTRALGSRLRGQGVAMVDAPVSGGVARAGNGTLSVMVGGEDDVVADVEGLLSALGRVFRAGSLGAGHAVKALNNLMSAVHLLASSEAIVAGQAFGLDPAVVLQIVNASTGRSASTEVKWPRYVMTDSFDSGFRLGLMVKDMRTAVALGDGVGVPLELGRCAAALWARAAAALPDASDHTEIARWVRDRPSG